MNEILKDTETPEKGEEQLSDETDILEISDEEFLNGTNEPEEPITETEEETEDTSEEETVTEEEETEDTSEEDSTSEEDTDTDKDIDTDKKTDDDSTEESKKEDSTEEEEPKQDVDYSKFYKNVMKPFKANGKMITPESEDDVVHLMQMGANYVKKMATIKPALKVLSSLEKNNIDENELNYLIDLKNKNKDAVKKFMKESDIDWTEYDETEKVDYTPSNNLATDEEAMFNQTIKDIQDSPHFDTTKKIVTETWDKESKEKILKDPELLVRLHEEVELDRFDKVQSIVEKERVFGRLKGISDLDAYVQVVSKLAQEEKTPPATPEPPQEKKTVKPVNKTVNKKSAQPSPKKTKESSVKLTDDEILDMSDEAFLKLERKKLY